ncbi:hypothetical protein QQF64_029870 [Cirrhinus molitorella]|uniref:SWIM-type domain-containing protein n=1 Tax=Cirrhinus molitorella TaxID=172907 RepID=A0ABR3N1U1_9TELE
MGRGRMPNPTAVLLKGYSNWIEGYITDIKVRKSETGCVVRARAFRSMRKNDTPYMVQVDFPSEGSFDVGLSKCNCKAGLGHCNHQIGLLYTLAHYIKMGYKSIPPTYKLLMASKRHPMDKVDSEFGLLPHGSALTYQVVGLPSTSTDHYPPFSLLSQPCNYTTVLSEKESIFYSGMTVTPSDAEALEKETRGHTLATSMQKQKRSVQTQAMKRGLELEPDAAAQYEQAHLLVDSTGVLGLLEIKCPDVDSVLECKYLSVKEDGVLALKSSHEYHYQMIGQMGITGITWCDFFVKSRNYYHLERIDFDEEKWESIKTKLDLFFFNCWLPNLCL